MASNTLQDWQNYINDYEQKLASKKQELDSKLNNSSLSDAEKKQALEDYTKQESYLQWLKTKCDEYEATGEIPSDMSLNITVNGDLYRYNGRIRVAKVPLLTSYTGTTVTLNTINIGTTLTTKSFDICSSPDCNINLTWGGNHTFDQYTHESLKLVATYAPDARAIIIGVIGIYSEDPWDKTCYMAASGSGTWVNASGYTPLDPASSYGGIDSGYVKFGIGYNYEIANTLNDIPTWQDSFYGMFYGPTIWQSFHAPDKLFARRFCSVSYSGDLSDTTPWDFYNDDILPNIDPDNAVFPNGYEPPGPYMEWYEVLTYDISCYKNAADETKIKLEFKQPVEKNGNPLKTTTIIFSENENNWAGTVTETPEASEGEIKITPFYLGECLSRRCNNEQ